MNHPFDQPNNEWTADYVHNVSGAPMHYCMTLADAHNAALAAERERAINTLREVELEHAEQSGKQIKQLAAEREKVRQWEELALEKIRSYPLPDGRTK